MSTCHIFFLSPCRTRLILLDICIHYDINKPTFSLIHQDLSLWPANLKYLKNWLNTLNHQLKRPITPMNLERPKPCSCRPYLVLICSQLVLPSAAPEPASAGCRTNSETTVLEPVNPARSQAAGADKTCRLNRNRNCSNHFSNRPTLVNPLRWKRSTGLMKQPSGKKCRLPLSIGCSPATAGVHRKIIVQKAKNKGKHHECFGQTLHRCHSPCFSLCYLVLLVCRPARFDCRRSYQRAFGGDL